MSKDLRMRVRFFRFTVGEDKKELTNCFRENQTINREYMVMIIVAEGEKRNVGMNIEKISSKSVPC